MHVCKRFHPSEILSHLYPHHGRSVHVPGSEADRIDADRVGDVECALDVEALRNDHEPILSEHLARTDYRVKRT